MIERLDMTDKTDSPEVKKYGANVELTLKLLRHGERTKDGLLTDYGRNKSREVAGSLGVGSEDYDAVKAVGSMADAPDSGMGRALETADIYADEIAGDEAFKTRANDLLNYENMKLKPPYNHREVYNSFLPDDFDTISDEEKAAAAKVAQREVVNHLINLKTPEAMDYKKEVVGAYAEYIANYDRTAQKLKSGSKVLIPSGTHGGAMEQVLIAAMVSTNPDGSKKVGLDKIEEIGGEIDPSEGFNVSIKTDDQGKRLPLEVTFDNPNRPQGDFYLDDEVLADARKFYEELHLKDESQEDAEEKRKFLVKEFEGVRDIPYRLPLSTTERNDSCAGKTTLLFKRLTDLGYDCRYRICSFRWSDLDIPAEVINIPHKDDSTHVYLEVEIDGEWKNVDPSWDRSLNKILPVNNWDGKSDTQVAVPALELYSTEKSGEFFEQEELSAESKKIIEERIEKNGPFFRAFNDWLAVNRIEEDGELVEKN